MSVIERKINIINTPIELIVSLINDISSDYIPIDQYINTWTISDDISENMTFNYHKHKNVIKYLIYKTCKIIDKYLSFFMCISVKINPWIIYSAITPRHINPLENILIPVENHVDFTYNFLGIQYYAECESKEPQPQLLIEWYNQIFLKNALPVCIKFKYLNNDFFFRIKYLKKLGLPYNPPYTHEYPIKKHIPTGQLG